MFHPLIKMLATRPEMLAEHVGAYAELAAAETAYAVEQMRTKALVGAGSALLGLIGLIFAGVALLLCGALPVDDMPAAWLLVVVPALPLLGAIGGALWLKSRPPTPSFSRLREQMERDNGLMQEARAS
jgi:hypothetical protein